MAVWPDLLGPEHGGPGRAGAATGHTSWSAAVIRRLRCGQFGNRDQYRLEATYYLTLLPVDGGAGLGRDGDQAPMAILHAGLPRRTGGCCYCWAGPGWWLPSRVRAGSGSDMAAVASGSSVPAVAAGSVRLVSRPGPGFSVSLPTMPVSAWPLEVVSWGAPARGRPLVSWVPRRVRSGSAPDMPTVLVGCSVLVAAGSGSVRLVSRPGPGFSVSLPSMPVSVVRSSRSIGSLLSNAGRPSMLASCREVPPFRAASL